MMKSISRSGATGFLLALAVMIALSLGLAQPVSADDDLPLPTLPSFDIPTPTPLPVAKDSDLIIDDMPISVDYQPGMIYIDIPLKYKLMPVNYYSYQLQYLEVFPVFDNPNETPFEISSSQLIRSLIDINTRFVDGRPVTYLSFPLKIKEDTLNGYYNVRFHARFMHQGGSLLYDSPAETDMTVAVQIVNGIAPTPTPTPTPLPTTPPPQPLPKVIISAFKTEPDTIMIGDEFSLTLSLLNTSTKTNVSNIKCTIDGGETIVPVTGSSSFYIPEIRKDDSFNYELIMSAQPAPASSNSAVGKSQHTVRVKMEYEYRAGDTLQSAAVEESFTINVRQEVKVELNPARVDPPEVTDGDYFDVSMSLINKGKAAIYNLTARFEGPSVFRPDDVFFGGLVNPGESKAIAISCSVLGGGGSYMGSPSIGGGGVIMRGGGSVVISSAMPMPVADMSIDGSLPIGEMPVGDEEGMFDGEEGMPVSGPQPCAIIITYEDEYGIETREEMPITVTYYPADNGSSDMDYGMESDYDAFAPDGMYPGEEEAPPAGPLGLPVLVFWGGVGVIVVGLLVVAIVLLRKRAKRKSVDTDEVA